MVTPIQHHDWLSLIEISGPFLALPVLKEIFPQGLEELDGIKRQRLRQAYEEWREALETGDPQFEELHAAWIDEVLSRGLELNEDARGGVLKSADWCAVNLSANLPEYGVTLSPDLAVIDEQRTNRPLMLIHAYVQDVDFDVILKPDGWAASPADRMVQLCRAIDCRLGLVTNGERWMLVDAPVGAVTTFASWYARIWSQEPITLQAFVHLLGIRRFFVDEAEQLPALFDRSLKYQDEVTDALGEQVRCAVEVLIQALDKADQDRGRELLQGVQESELYGAALTVMMRLVFLLSAEERGLLLLGDERYEANYALSTLRMQLRKESEEILERRWDAWSRLLAIFRIIFGGIEHENLRLPALGGSLFDPDRFPFLEGRAKGSDWHADMAKPLPIDNRTVLLLLDAIQKFQGRTLSYRALDVEQIGYVYEGLLERTAERTTEVTLELDSTKKSRAPWVRLTELESAQMDGSERLAELLKERSGSSASRVRKDLDRPVDDMLGDRLLVACSGDTATRNRIRPYAHLVRTDPWGYPLVYPAGAFIVTTGSDRRKTGTYYTPKSLTEAIVTETLTPIVYVGPAEGAPREQWVLKSSAELLNLKICDPAMGSGAFLVQACRYLADRLVEAWSQAEDDGKMVSVDGEVLAAPATKEPLSCDTEARAVIARRLIAERCLYGVDLNPLAVELAKLSIWLVTLAKGRPFGFLDHNLRCGDSLLGIYRLDQLTQLSMTSSEKQQQRLFGQNIERLVHEAIELRQQLRAMPVRDIRDVDAKARLDADARDRLEMPERIADALIGEIFVSGSNGTTSESALASLTTQAKQAIDGDQQALILIRRRLVATLSADLPNDGTARQPFHWPLEFPEVFAGKQGFNAIIGNPPFLGGRRQRAVLGSLYQIYMANVIGGGGSRNADLCAFFFRRAGVLVNKSGSFGLVATNSLRQGATREMGLKPLTQQGLTIYRAITNFEWPGDASVTASIVWLFVGKWGAEPVLDGNPVSQISCYLSSVNIEDWSQKELFENDLMAFQGSNVLGSGFILSREQADRLIKANPANASVIKPFVRGEDFNSMPDQKPLKWVIDFQGWPLRRSPSDCSDVPVAQDFPECLEIVETLVKPQRSKATRNAYRERWWQYAERCRSLYATIKDYQRIIFHSLTSKHICFGFVQGGCVYSGPHTVIASESVSVLALLQSSIHTEWAWQFCSTMRNSGIRYNPSDFRKFPRPSLEAGFYDIAERFHGLRQRVMQDRGYGLTALYNDYHHPSVQDQEISDLRNFQREIDQAIALSYGWNDLEIELAHHQTNQGSRFTLPPPVLEKALARLVTLNRERYEEEDARGMHEVKTRKTTRRTPRGKHTGANASSQHSLDLDVSLANEGADIKPSEPRLQHVAGPAQAIIEYLKANSGWHAKADVLGATGIPSGKWNSAINDLISIGDIERQGERRGARYRAVIEETK